MSPLFLLTRSCSIGFGKPWEMKSCFLTDILSNNPLKPWRVDDSPCPFQPLKGQFLQKGGIWSRSPSKLAQGQSGGSFLIPCQLAGLLVFPTPTDLWGRERTWLQDESCVSLWPNQGWVFINRKRNVPLLCRCSVGWLSGYHVRPPTRGTYSWRRTRQWMEKTLFQIYG